MRIPRIPSVAVAACLAAGVAASAVPAPARAEDVFFRDPDRETQRRIDDLVTQLGADAPVARRRARAELEGLGWWAVDPLIAALRDREPQVTCAAVLALSGVGDRRALAPLRDVVVREDSNPFVASFAVLALGRLRDGASTDAFRRALANPKCLEMVRAAVPLALARLRTPEAAQVLREQAADNGALEFVTSARLLACGFFPELALDSSFERPSAILESGLASRRRGEQRAAVLGFLVATARGGAGREYLLQFSEGNLNPQTESAVLLGLAAFPDAEVTGRLCRTMAGGGPDALRELACDLLIRRADAAALAPLLQSLRAQSSSPRLRAAAVLALAAIDAPQAREAVAERFVDKSPLVRAAVAVAAARSSHAGLRDDVAARIASRLRSGETDARAREVMGLAAQVLAGERRDVLWPEAGQEPLFSLLPLTQRQRLLAEVNRRAMLSLDLGKISDPQNEDELIPATSPGINPAYDLRGGRPDGPAGSGVPIPTQGGLPSTGIGPVGSARTSDWPELRDLAADLTDRPYFGADDLPAPPAAATGAVKK